MKISVKIADLQKLSAKEVGYVKPKPKSIKPVSDADGEKVRENVQLIELCSQYWMSLSDFRKRRKRNRKYYRGDQWHEMIKDPDSGETVTEETYIKSRGKIPFKQNVIRQLTKNMIGQYRTMQSKPMVVAVNREDNMAADMMNSAIHSVHTLNHVKELDARNLEEFLLSGASIGKIAIKYFPEKDRKDVYYENVNPNRIFFNSDVSDIRLSDIHIIGEIIDTTVDDIVAAFSRTKAHEKQIREHYNMTIDDYLSNVGKGLSPAIVDTLSFVSPTDHNKARVVEVWQKKGEWKLLAHDYLDGTYQITDYTKEEIDEINKERIMMMVEAGGSPEDVALIEYEDIYDDVWHVKYLSPYGWTLYESESPYMHQSHPYALTLYPLLDGEVWGAVEDIIDQQRYINRLISLLDFIMGSSAKGVLLVPEESIPADMNIDEFSEEWSKFNGVIKIKTKGGVQLPQQVSANSTNIGAHELLSLQLNLVESIMGVSNAIQGQQAKSGTPASLYAQEAQNSTINSRDIFEAYNFFKLNRDSKMLKTVLQQYQEKRPILSPDNNQEVRVYDPDVVKDVDFEFVVSQSMDTPIYRQLMDDTLWKLLEAQMIDIKMYLEHSTLPYADRLLGTINEREREMMESQQMPQDLAQGISDTRQAAEAQSDPMARELISRALAEQHNPVGEDF